MRYSFVSGGRVLAGKKLQKILKSRKNLRLKRISSINKAYKNPEYRKKLSRIKKEFYKNYEKRREIDKIVTSWWREHPLVKKEYAKKAKIFFSKNTEAFQKFLKAGKNPIKQHIKTKQGFLVRSKGEKIIADFLHKNKIKAEYESKTLFLDSYIFVPDFYLPKHKAFIEFYGGYPGSWKKKVLKNKIYKKHNIKVISITPADLRELKELKKFTE